MVDCHTKSWNKKMIIGLLFLFISINIPSAMCFDFDVEIKPDEGQSNTEIWLYVMGDPFRTKGRWYLYVFWDDLNIIQKNPDVYLDWSKEYEHRWEVKITAPTSEKRFTTRKKHTIEIWVMNSTGEIKKEKEIFEITKTIPAIEWWEDLPKKLIESLEGEKGDRGVQGIQGKTGEMGERGEQGVRGEKGKTGDIGEQGIQGEKGEKGERGDSGEDGKSYNVFMFNTIGFIGFISLILSIYTLKIKTEKQGEKKI